jgi:hypothetical protein
MLGHARAQLTEGVEDVADWVIEIDAIACVPRVGGAAAAAACWILQC